LDLEPYGLWLARAGGGTGKTNSRKKGRILKQSPSDLRNNRLRKTKTRSRCRTNGTEISVNFRSRSMLCPFALRFFSAKSIFKYLLELEPELAVSILSKTRSHEVTALKIGMSHMNYLYNQVRENA